MSVSADLLAHAVPTRLRKVEDGWVMEVESLEVVGRGLYRPTPRKIEGEHAIIAHLASLPEGDGLGVRARHLLEAGTDERRSYVPVSGDWLAVPSANDGPSSPPEADPVDCTADDRADAEEAPDLGTSSAPQPLPEPPPEPPTHQGFGEHVYDELRELRTSRDALMARMDELEARLSELAALGGEPQPQ